MHKLRDQAPSDPKGTIRAYLLGELGPEEQEWVEQRYFVDRDFFEEVSILEDEIIDEYLSDALSEREAFGRSFLLTSRRRQKVRQALALKLCISELEDQAASKSTEETSWLRIFRPWRRAHTHPIGTA